MSTPTTRELPLAPGCSALLLVDLQNYCCHPDGKLLQGCAPSERAARFGHYEQRLRETVLPNAQKVLAACRAHGVEVIHTCIESLTQDGRDRSLDYKISGIHAPRGSWDAQPVAELAPLENEIRLPKTASSVFNATHIDYVLRNLGVERLAICGVMTDQCVESAVRDACDHGYLVTLLTDCCATLSAEREAQSLLGIRGYCRQATAQTVIDELAAASP